MTNLIAFALILFFLLTPVDTLGSNNAAPDFSRRQTWKDYFLPIELFH